MQYRRSMAEGASYFFTVVTHGRNNMLCRDENVKLIKEAFRHVGNGHPFTIDAFVLLPDHLHCIWTLPAGDSDYSTRWRLIKRYFSKKCADAGYGPISESRRKKGEREIWQRRFWEHQIRDERDFVRHIEYIHYNPVKHGLADAPVMWAHSSFHQYVREGRYESGWGSGQPVTFDDSIGNE